VKRKSKRLDKRRPQLDGALALFGANNAVAGCDSASFTQRVGELIARAANKRGPPKPAIKSAGRP